MHCLRLAQLARGVSDSTVSANIQDVISLVAPPGVEIPATCDRQNRILRGEVTLSGETMAAWKFAKAKRIVWFGWDESTKFGDAVFSCHFVIEHDDGAREDICLRGLTIMPEGGTSKAVLNHIEKEILSYSRRILSEWMKDYEKHNGGAGSWAAAGGPSPENIGVHRLCEDTVLMTDTCNGARCTKRMLAASIMATIEEKVGKEAWEKMTTEVRPHAPHAPARATCARTRRSTPRSELSIVPSPPPLLPPPLNLSLSHALRMSVPLHTYLHTASACGHRSEMPSTKSTVGTAGSTSATSSSLR